MTTLNGNGIQLVLTILYYLLILVIIAGTIVTSVYLAQYIAKEHQKKLNKVKNVRITKSRKISILN